MKCSHWEYKISAYLDNETTAEESDAIEHHLAECTQCQELAKNIQKIKTSNLQFKNISVSPYFAQKVLASFRAQQRTTFWNYFDFLPRPLIYSALVVSVIVIAILFRPNKQMTQVADDSTSDYAVIFDNGQTSDAIVTNDQALQFALEDAALVVSEGGQK